MKNKKSIIIAIVFIALVVLYFVLSTSSCGTKAPDAAAPEESSAVSAADPAVSAADGSSAAASAAGTDAQSTDKDAAQGAQPAASSGDASAQPAPETVQEAVVLQNGGELEIVVPEGMDHDGF